MLQIIPKAVKHFRFLPSNFYIATKSFCDNKKEESPEGKDSNEQKKTEKPVKADKASDSLNKLLASMNTKESLSLKKIELQKPGARKQKLKEKKSKEYDSSSSDDEKPKTMKEAVEKVTSVIGGSEPVKAKEIESELLNKLLNIAGGNTGSLTDLIKDMQVDREDKKPAGTFVRRNQGDAEMSKADRVRRSMDTGRERYSDNQGRQYNDRQQEQGQYQRQPREQLRVLQTNISGKSVNLFNSEPLSIFKNVEQLKDNDLLVTWNELVERELKLTVTHPPANYFEKMILWTEQEKLWKFPIDNEQGMDEEAKVYFTEHIFLEKHLEEWCPTKGPIRHFMELVCVGLSKNYYISAQEKLDHINWFKQYFEEKKDILASVIQESKTIAAPPTA